MAILPNYVLMANCLIRSFSKMEYFDLNKQSGKKMVNKYGFLQKVEFCFLYKWSKKIVSVSIHLGKSRWKMRYSTLKEGELSLSTVQIWKFCTLPMELSKEKKKKAMLWHIAIINLLSWNTSGQFPFLLS